MFHKKNSLPLIVMEQIQVHSLGSPLSVHKRRWERFICWYFPVLFLFGIVGLVSTYWYAMPEHSHMQVMGDTFGRYLLQKDWLHLGFYGFMVVAGMLIWLVFLLLPRDLVVVCEDGLLIFQERKIEKVRWDELAEIQGSDTSGEYLFVRTDDTYLRLDMGFYAWTHTKQLREAIKQVCLEQGLW